MIIRRVVKKTESFIYKLTFFIFFNINYVNAQDQKMNEYKIINKELMQISGI